MGITLQDNSWTKVHMTHLSLTRGVGWGLIGGLAGTMVMDLVLMVALPVAGLPALPEIPHENVVLTANLSQVSIKNK